jgi:AcrR family transcriptional regulator
MKPRDTREKILEAGLTLFSKKGYLGATTREIAGKAGVAEVTLFRYFSSKEKLFEEIVQQYSFLPALKGLLPEIKNMHYRDALCRIAERFLERLYERRDLIRIMHSEIHRYPSKVKGIYHNFVDEIFGNLASYFRELQNSGGLRGFNPEIGARAFLGMFFSYFNAQEMLLKKNARYRDKNRVIREFVEIFIEGTVK